MLHVSHEVQAPEYFKHYKHPVQKKSHIPDKMRGSNSQMLQTLCHQTEQANKENSDLENPAQAPKNFQPTKATTELHLPLNSTVGSKKKRSIAQVNWYLKTFAEPGVWGRRGGGGAGFVALLRSCSAGDRNGFDLLFHGLSDWFHWRPLWTPQFGDTKGKVSYPVWMPENHPSCRCRVNQARWTSMTCLKSSLVSSCFQSSEMRRNTTQPSQWLCATRWILP